VSRRSHRRRPDLHDIAAEIVRRACLLNGNDAEVESRIIPVGDPPTPHERLQALAAGLQGIPVGFMRRDCMTIEEWIEHYGVTESDS